MTKGSPQRPGHSFAAQIFIEHLFLFFRVGCWKTRVQPDTMFTPRKLGKVLRKSSDTALWSWVRLQGRAIELSCLVKVKAGHLRLQSLRSTQHSPLELRAGLEERQAEANASSLPICSLHFHVPHDPPYNYPPVRANQSPWLSCLLGLEPCITSR
jgi:hypothetical protein